jgi:hypothetical protein
MPFDHNRLALFEKVKQPGQMRLRFMHAEGHQFKLRLIFLVQGVGQVVNLQRVANPRAAQTSGKLTSRTAHSCDPTIETAIDHVFLMARLISASIPAATRSRPTLSLRSRMPPLNNTTYAMNGATA